MMSKFPMSFRWIFQVLNKLWIFVSYLFHKQFRKVLQYQPVKYDLYPLSPGRNRVAMCSRLRALVHRRKFAYISSPPRFSLSFFALAVSRHRLSLVQRKTLVLDLDETLIHSHHDGLPRNPTIKPGTPHDFTVSCRCSFLLLARLLAVVVVALRNGMKLSLYIFHTQFAFISQVSVVIDRHPVRFFVHKRPHVDFFLDIVSQWYDLVVFTASMEIYGAAVTDKLDNGRNILNRR